MQEYFIELSKYLITAWMIVYTLSDFAVLLPEFFHKKLVHRRLVYGFQGFLIFTQQLIMFADLALVSRSMEYLFLYAFVQIFLLAALVMVPMIYEKINRFLLNNMCMLLGIGLCVLSRLSFKKAERQYIMALIALTLSLLIPWLLERVRSWKRFTWLYGVAGILILSTVLILGEVTHGSKITFTIDFSALGRSFTFQPSEFVKILYVFFLAGALREKQTFSRVALTAAFAGLHVIILVVSKDLGGALIFFVSYVFVVFAATRNYLYLLAGGAGGCAASYLAYFLFDHVRARVLAWRDPWAYIDSKGYAITQSLFAIGSGSWFGMGLFKGNPTAIPYVESDFIFSAVCEELGVIFGCCLLLVTICCFLCMMKTAVAIRDRFYQIIVYGIGIMYIFQIFLTVGGGIKLIPLTGVTLPFLSYGGSSVMSAMFMFFIVQGIYIRLQQEGGREDDGKKAVSE